MAKAKAESKDLFDFPHAYPISKFGFKIPGLGKSGEKCGVNRMSDFSPDGESVKYSPLHCGRIECPTCYPSWANETVFRMAVRIEAYSLLTGERPKAMIMSVPPQKVKGDNWNWDRVNTSLFRRGYRRSKDHAGVDGGLAVFHPFRIKKITQKRLKRSGKSKSGGMWKTIRKWVKGGKSLYDFVNLSPHVHSIVFGDPKTHRSEDYLIRFRDDDHNLPVDLEDASDVVGLIRYLISHTGVLTHLKKYENGVQRRKTQTIREFGSLFRFHPHKELDVDQFNDVCESVANSIILRKENGKKITMVWDRQKVKELLEDGEDFPKIVSECLRYPASPKDLDTSKEEPNWISIYKLKEYLDNSEWFSKISPSQRKFWLNVSEFMKSNDRPPNWGEVDPPPSIEVWGEVEAESDREFFTLEGGS